MEQFNKTIDSYKESQEQVNEHVEMSSGMFIAIMLFSLLFGCFLHLGLEKLAINVDSIGPRYLNEEEICLNSYSDSTRDDVPMHCFKYFK